MKLIHKACFGSILVLLFLSGLCPITGSLAQTNSIDNKDQIPNYIQKVNISSLDTSIQLARPDFGNNLISRHYQEPPKGINSLKSSPITTTAENILVQTKDFKVSYQFALYDTIPVIKFITAFEIESTDNGLSFEFDMNNNRIVDPNFDKGYSSYYGGLCNYYFLETTSTTISTSFCGVFPTNAWNNFGGKIKSISLNIPVNEIEFKQSIYVRLRTNNFYWWPNDDVQFSKVYTIQIPDELSKLGTVLSKDASEISQNACKMNGIVTPSINSVLNESGIVWSKNENVDLENNLGKIVNKASTSEFSARLDGLSTNTKYFYRVYAIINNFPIYGKLLAFQTKIDSTQFLNFDKNLIISNSGKNIIAIVSADEFNKWRQYPQWDLIKSISKPLYSKIKDDFDFVFLIANSNLMAQGNNVYGVSYQVSNEIKGIGLSNFEDTFYGSSGRLKSFIWLPVRGFLKTGPTLHEMLHSWANCVIDSRALLGDNTSSSGLKEYRYGANNGSHWGVSTVGGQLGGFDKLISNVDGESNKYQGMMRNRYGFGQNANGGNGLPYSNLELYLMGLIPPEEVIPVKFFYKLSVKNQDEFYGEGKFYSDSVVNFDITKITETAGGPRIPDYKSSQKEFKALIVMVSNTMPTTDEMTEMEECSDWLEHPGPDDIDYLYNFYEATGGRAKLSFENSLKSLKLAGSDQSVFEGKTVTLDGLTSFNPVDNTLKYKWTAPVGITLSSNSVTNPTFTAPEVKKDTTFTLSLMVTNGKTDFPTDQVKITVRNINRIKIAAGSLASVLTSNQLATLSNLTLTGTIDARDFKTMRDNMPKLTDVDLSGVTIVTYNGTEGTSEWGNTYYPANTIPEFAFECGKRTSFTSIVIPESTTSIGVCAFQNCSALKDFSFPNSVKTIGQSAFFMCRSLTSITLPSSVTAIGIQAFLGCNALASLTVGWLLPLDLSSSIGVFQAVDTNTCILHVPYGSSSLYASANQWKDFTHIVDVLTANAGQNQTVNEGTVVSLNGSAFSSPGTPITYKWIAPEGITLNSTTSAKPTFKAPEVKKDSILTFSLIVNDGIVNSAPSTVKVTILNVIKAGVSTIESPLFKVYPNPTTGKVYLEIYRGTDSKTEVLVMNLVGWELFRREVVDAAKFQIDLSSYISGVYLLKISNNKQQYISKIVVKKN